MRTPTYTLPRALQQRTIGNVETGEIFYLPSHCVYLQEKTQTLWLDDRDQLPKHAAKPTKLLGQVGILCDIIANDHGNILRGYVADCRFVKDGNEFDAIPEELPVDDDEVRYFLDLQSHLIPIDALIAKNGIARTSTTMLGDKRFFASLTPLIKHTNKLRKSMDKKYRKELAHLARKA